VQGVAKLFEELTKLDMQTKEIKTWSKPDCYIGEPVFVSKTNPKNSDDGVILSVVLDGQKETSFVLIVDAKTFEEIAKIELPKIVTFGFHGDFVGED